MALQPRSSLPPVTNELPPRVFGGLFGGSVSWNAIAKSAGIAIIISTGSYILIRVIYPTFSWRSIFGSKKLISAKDLPRPTFGRTRNGKFKSGQPTKEQLEIRQKLETIPSRNSETRIENLMVYPIKSCGGIEVDTYFCGEMGPEIHTSSGIVRDRGWMIVKKNNIFLTQRQKPRMCFIKTSIEEPHLIVDAPGMATLRVPIRLDDSTSDLQIFKTKVWGTEISAVDCGDEAGLWFSKFLEEDGLRLLHHPFEFGGRICQNDSGIELWGDNDKAAFSDLAPYLLLSQESVQDLNTRGVEKEVPWINFRPVILVSGCPPYDEDVWTDFSIGDAHFRNTKLCTRCVLTTVDTETGTFRKEILEVLRSYRVNQTPAWEKIYENHPLLAINLAIGKLGKISVGDRILHSQYS